MDWRKAGGPAILRRSGPVVCQPGEVDFMRYPLRFVALAFVTVALAACGDPPTSDHRGYTKAPLEQPGIRISPEKPTSFRAFAHPNLPDGQPIVLQDTSKASG
jgi:hypothetical protein